MKKLIVFLMLVLLSLSSKAYSKDMAGKFGFGGNWFYYLPTETDFEGADIDVKGSPEAFNLHLSYCLPKPDKDININIILDWEHIKKDLEDEDPGIFSDDIGTVTLMPLMINAQIRFARFDIISPYIGFGLGISFNSIEEGKQLDEVEEYFESIVPSMSFDTDIDIDHSFAFKIPVGIDIHILENIALNLEARYFYTTPELELKVENLGSEDDEIDLSSFAFGLGINLYF